MCGWEKWEIKTQRGCKREKKKKNVCTVMTVCSLQVSSERKKTKQLQLKKKTPFCVCWWLLRRHVIFMRKPRTLNLQRTLQEPYKDKLFTYFSRHEISFSYATSSVSVRDLDMVCWVLRFYWRGDWNTHSGEICQYRSINNSNKSNDWNNVDYNLYMKQKYTNEIKIRTRVCMYIKYKNECSIHV